MHAWIGTSGFAFKSWKGPFYLEDLPDREMLRHFATRLPAVEINNTFYQLPRPAAIAGWSAQTAEAGGAFRFAIKASQKITHWKRLVATEEEIRYLLGVIEPLGERLGCVLYQLPPNLKKDLPRLAAFLDLLALVGPATRAAFEFRHPSWGDDPEVLELLGGRGCAWVLAETDDEELEWRRTAAPWGYLRLRREEYSESDLAAWAERLVEAGWPEVFVFFKHEDAGKGPRLAARLLELLGRPAPSGARS